jgi:hypothetical protein
MVRRTTYAQIYTNKRLNRTQSAMAAFDIAHIHYLHSVNIIHQA